MPLVDMSGVQLPSLPDVELPDMPSIDLPSVPDMPSIELPAVPDFEMPAIPSINTAPVEEVANQILNFCDSVIKDLSAAPSVVQEPKTTATQEILSRWKGSKKTRKTRTPEIAAPLKPAADAVPYQAPELIVPTEVIRSEFYEEDVVAEIVPSVDADGILAKGTEVLDAMAGFFTFSPAVPQTLEEVRAELQKAEHELTGIKTTLTNMRSMLEANEIAQMKQEKTRLKQWISRLQEQEKALTAKDEPSAAAQAFKAFTGWSW